MGISMNIHRRRTLRRALKSASLLASASALGLGSLSPGRAETRSIDATPLPEIEVVAPHDIESGPPGATVLTNIQSNWPTLSDTARLMSDVPGGAYYGAGGVSSLPVLNGFGDDQLNVQVDGMDFVAACANHMNPPMSYIPPTRVGNVTVFSTLVPVSVGGDSIGGAILVEPPAPVFASPGQAMFATGSAGAYYRSNGDAFGANAAATAATQDVSVTYNGSLARSNNYTAGGAFKAPGFAYPGVAGLNLSIPWLGGNVVGSTAYEVYNNDLALAVRRQNHLFQIDVGVQTIPYQGFPNARMDMTSNQSVSINAKYTGLYDWGDLDGQIDYQNVRHVMNFGDDKQYWYGDVSSVLSPGMPMDTHAETGGAKVTAKINLSDRDKLRVGAELQLYTLNEWWPSSPSLPVISMMSPDTFINVNNGKRNRADLFAEWERRWSPQWTTQIGVRSDTVFMSTGPVQGYNAMMYDPAPLYPATTFNNADRNRTDQNWNITALATYTPNVNQQYVFGVSQKSNSPNLYERYAWSPMMMAMEMIGWYGDGNYYIGNLNLKPEVARTLSASADFHDASGDLGLQVRPYLSFVENYIDVQRCPLAVCGASAKTLRNLTASQGFVSLQFVNQNARLFGVDVSGHASLAKDTALGDFTAKGAVSYVNGKNTTTGDNLYNIMPLNAKLSLEQTWRGWTNTFEAQFVAAKTDVSWVRNEVPTPGYSLFNFRTAYAWRNFRFEAGVENIFNRFYSLPLGGAYLGQGATMGGSAIAWGVPVPGMGRSFYVATNVKF